MTQFRLANDAVRKRVKEAVDSAPDGHVVTIKPPKRDRSAAQKGLYFLWTGIIAAYTGETKEEVHHRQKETHLIPIYAKREDGEFAAMIASIEEVKRQGFEKEYKVLWRRIVDMVSTSDASVKEFTEYLNDIEQESIAVGINLPRPEDLYLESMGRWQR